jgi:hypothetical protein
MKPGRVTTPVKHGDVLFSGTVDNIIETVVYFLFDNFNPFEKEKRQC